MKFEDLNDDEREFLELNSKMDRVIKIYEAESSLTIERGNFACKLVFKIDGDEFKIIGSSLKDACRRLGVILDGIN